MQGKSSLAAGFRTLSHGKLILLLALTAAVLGLLGALPITPAFRSVLGGTLAGDHFIRNHPTLAPMDYYDFRTQQEYAILGMRRAAIGAGVWEFCSSSSSPAASSASSARASSPSASSSSPPAATSGTT